MGEWRLSNLGNMETNVNAIGYFRSAQVQALNVGMPLIRRHPMMGFFTLTIGVEQSTPLVPEKFHAVPHGCTANSHKWGMEAVIPIPRAGQPAFFQLRAV